MGIDRVANVETDGARGPNSDRGSDGVTDEGLNGE